MGTYLGGNKPTSTRKQVGEYMRRRVPGPGKSILRRLAAAGLVLLIGSGAALAQSGNPAAQDQGKPPAANAADAAKDNQRKTDEFVEATQAISGPAGNPE